MASATTTQPKADHFHRWRLDEPNGPLSSGVCKVCGVTKQNLSQSPTSAGIQDKLADLEEIAGLLPWCGSEAKFKAWLKRPNRDFALLDGKILSPLDLILMGRARSVANKVHHMLLGHPS